MAELALKKAAAALAAHEDGFDGVWESDDDDEILDENKEREYVEATLASVPPTGMPPSAWRGYKETLATMGFKRARMPLPDMPIGRGVLHTSTRVEDVARLVDHPNTRCVNIVQPFATLIALGLKDVENRTTPLPHNQDGDYCWIAIVASAVDPNKGQRAWDAIMRDVGRRIWWNNGYEAPDLPVVPRDKREYPSQSVVAMAKIRCSAPKQRGREWTGKQSVWNNGDLYAWEVVEVHRLRRPVLFGTGNQTPATFLTPKPTEGDVARIARMAKIRHAIKSELTRHKRGVGSLQTPAVVASLDRLGCAAFSLANVVDSSAFLANLGEASRMWFFTQLREALKLDSSQRHKTWDASAATLESQKHTWASFSDARRNEILSLLDPSTTLGLEALFIDEKRKSILPIDVVDLLTSRVRYVKQGMSFMGQSAMHKSWSTAGFGKWARINPGVGLVITRHVKDTLTATGFQLSLDDNLPHLIYKPPSGKQLHCHHDAMTTENLLNNLRTRRNLSMTEWARQFGLQTLCHVEGGRSDGYTYIVGPMTPNKLFLCVEALYDNKVPDAFKDVDAHRHWKTSSTGPFYAFWTKPKVLQSLNNILKQHGETPVREIPIRPSGEEGAGAYVALWPVGVPHGSSKNTTRRVTITLPLNSTGKTLPQGSRAERRLYALATVAASDAEIAAHGVLKGTPLQQRQTAEKFIGEDTERLAQGKTHAHLEYASEYIRHANGAAQLNMPVGPYASIAPSLSQVKAFFGP